MWKILWMVLALVGPSLQTSPAKPQCPQGSLLFDSRCIKIRYQQGCARYKSDNSCELCEFGYQLVKGKCSPEPVDNAACCAEYSKEGKCLRCAAGLFGGAEACFRNEVYGCILKQRQECLVCGDGLILVKGKCLTSVTGCQQYSSNGICSACEPHYRFDKGYCLWGGTVTNCLAHNEHGCIECQGGYYLTRQQTCLQFEPGCLSYWQEQCQACLPLFTLLNGKCIIPNCKTYSYDQCKECQGSYSLINQQCQLNGCLQSQNGSCLLCHSSLRLSSKGCVQPANYQCQQCAFGFIFANGRCLKAIPGCSQYTNKDLCGVCKSPFTLVDGLCLINGCQTYCQVGCHQCRTPFQLENNICIIENCHQYDKDGCLICHNGYLLRNRQCQPKDPHCLTYNQHPTQPICTSCCDRYYLLQGECRPSERGCLYDDKGNCKCKSGWASRVPGKCDLIGCQDYEWEQCKQCSAPFQLNKGSCLIPNCQSYNWQGCQQCQPSWRTVRGVCQSQIPNCLSYGEEGACLGCREGFVLSSGRCLKHIPYCRKWCKQGLSCLQCSSGYFLQNGICNQMIANCKEMDFKLNSCIVCMQNFHLVGGACQSNDPNCLTYAKRQTNTEICTQCQEGYYFQEKENKCVPAAFGCKYQGSACVSCYPPFTYDQQQKDCFISGCQKYDRKGCLSCKSPFKSSNQVCVIDQCASYSRQGCLQCQHGYSLSAGGLCVVWDPNCLAYEGTGCIKCKVGFRVWKGSCVAVDEQCQQYGNNGQICTLCNQGYHPDSNGKCQPDQPGCIYKQGKCQSCRAPFTYQTASSSCTIDNCLEASSQGCLRCQPPFQLQNDKSCQLDNCLRAGPQGCLQCKPQYHLSKGGCLPDDPNCRLYSPQGKCELCADNYQLDANGECIEGKRSCLRFCEEDPKKCLECEEGYFLNRKWQCEKQDGKCEAYTRGLCSKCKPKYFLFSEICFPYTPGCVKYQGKDCTECKTSFTLKNGECFKWQPQGLKLLGGDDHYDFEITPIDVRQSKYYIDNLSPASTIGKYFFSSSLDQHHQNCSLSTLQGQTSQGWKARTNDSEQFIGVTLDGEPATFYALQLEAVQQNQITQFYLEYSLDGKTFTKVQTAFPVPAAVNSSMVTIYFTGIYAKSIRVRISKFKGWPACRLQFFYYDLLRFRKISNLKSLTYLQETINSNFVDRVDNQLYINQVYFFNPNAECSVKQMCFTGLQLCEPRNVTSLTLSFTDGTTLTDFYLTYSLDGRSYNCYKNCKPFTVDKCINNAFSLNLDGGLRAQGVRIYPQNYKGSPKFSPIFYYQ